MKELQVINFNSVEVVDSREVAKLVEKRHTHLLRDIDGYVKIMEEWTEPKIGLSDFLSNPPTRTAPEGRSPATY